MTVMIFLDVQDLLEAHEASNTEATTEKILGLLCQYNLTIIDISIMVNDGDCMMIRIKSGVAARLRKQNGKLIAFQCWCHNLVLAFSNTNEIDM